MRNHPNIAMLRAVYADLSTIGRYVDDDVVLHPANRDIGAAAPLYGRAAIQAHERELIRATKGTLVMDVDEVAANDHFGAVLGVLRATGRHGDVAMPFCGLWRLRNGRIVEHWENAYDPAALGDRLALTSG